jgi:NADP-dependent 3-hydroxy acid dehydrogenase YdfG
MKSCAITGHTKGIGQAVYNLLSNDYVVSGFSRSTGFNIDTPSAILLLAKKCDIFINNAYHSRYQLELFEKLYKLWRFENKTIVNINSRAHYFPDHSEYVTHKVNLFESARAKMREPRQCNIINISPGFVVSNTITREWLEENNHSFLTAEQCAKYIKWAIEQPIEIGELSLWKT